MFIAPLLKIRRAPEERDVHASTTRCNLSKLAHARIESPHARLVNPYRRELRSSLKFHCRILIVIRAAIPRGSRPHKPNLLSTFVKRHGNRLCAAEDRARTCAG